MDGTEGDTGVTDSGRGRCGQRRDATSRPRPPLLTYGLIGCCALLFLVGPASGLLPVHGTGEELHRAQNAYFERWGVLPRRLWGGGWRPLLSPLTAMFLHGTWAHLLGNLLFLFVFGGMVERRMGGPRFLLCYLGTGVLAMLGYAAAYADSDETVVGASGAISGVLGAFLYLFPRARVTSVFPFLFFLPLRFPAWVVLLFWLAIQWGALRGAADGPGVAYLAHVLGFLLGFLGAWLGFRTDTVVRPAPATKGEPAP
ncbi:rhomboid family intramembrane serine protease [Streptomyces sp. AJS327]|uniref:rhomboid family intramembrane serine protease n=1 Tax=Streptomyces sp. AJS327 TaxID=2545265 RepID=UPI0015DD5CEA|nr:rhomboid family intramembrane serine protease [Streptomyces sp. AJS327]MBA0050282.1 rhomboid family intramembrane serine protease [Streptomyces sp. AJS327]